MAAAQSEQTHAALSAEMAAKQQLQHQLDNAMAHARREQEALVTQVSAPVMINLCAVHLLIFDPF